MFSARWRTSSDDPIQSGTEQLAAVAIGSIDNQSQRNTRSRSRGGCALFRSWRDRWDQSRPSRKGPLSSPYQRLATPIGCLCIPVHSTDTMAAKACRSDMRGRPPFACDGVGRISVSTCLHHSSLTFQGEVLAIVCSFAPREFPSADQRVALQQIVGKRAALFPSVLICVKRHYPIYSSKNGGNSLFITLR